MRFSWHDASCRQAAVKAAKILPLVGLARFKQDPVKRGHGAQSIYCPLPAGAVKYTDKLLRVLARRCTKPSWRAAASLWQ